MIEDNKYVSPSIEGKESAVKTKVVAFVDSELVEGKERQILSKLVIMLWLIYQQA